jgi:AcrR family transcriptional regulator
MPGAAHEGGRVTSGTVSGRGTDDGIGAAERILRSAIAELVLHGAGALAMHEVADRAGVSKGLIHYHYHDKDAMLARAAERLGERIAARGRGAIILARASTIVGDMREWLRSELRLGEWRALISLGEWPAPVVRDAAHAAIEARRDMMEEMAATMYARLGTRPRIATAQAGELLIALVSGLAAEPDADRDPSDAFDLLILALLQLAG